MAISASLTQLLPPSRATASYPQAKTRRDIIRAMEDTKKVNEYEPTLLDVLQAVQGGFQKMEERFDGVDERFDKVEGGLEKVETKLGEVENRMTGVERRVGAIEVTLDEMQGTLESIEQAVDKDAEAVVNHEDRISHLENLGGIVSVPVAHFAGLES